MKFLITTFCLTLISTHALGWGRIGHEATVTLAEKVMTPETSQRVRALLGQQPLREASLWADRIRALEIWQHTRPFHFTQVSDNATYFDSLDLQKGDGIRAMVKAEDVLRSPKSSAELKSYALRFLIHVLGDMHQPLHTGRPQDLGGNLIPIIWNNNKTNLHSVWDSSILSAPNLNEDDVDLYLQTLTLPAPDKVSAWFKGSYLEWHDEAMVLRHHSYASALMTPEEAVKNYRTLIDQQILKAGYRLGHVLNGIFGGKPLSREGLKLRSELKRILGADHQSHIVLVPAGQIMQDFYEDYHQCDH